MIDGELDRHEAGIYAMNPQLVILAAGLGSRYGGLKQLDAVGPAGATLMDYSVYDANRAGFGDVVFVIRPEMKEAFDEYAGRRLGSQVRWHTALQRLEDVPPGTTVPPNRTKPWGTTHAVLAAAELIQGPFAVLNADDFYGAQAFVTLAEFLRSGSADHALVGYRLGDTRSVEGTVNRAVCRTSRDGWLETIEEVRDLAMADDGSFSGRAALGAVRIAGDAIVSMNLWGFQPSVIDTLRAGLSEFFHRATPDECLLPTVIQAAIGRRGCRVRVLEGHSRWFGITHAADRDAVQASLQRLVNEGHYPERLWT
jgi:hypothetical protein